MTDDILMRMACFNDGNALPSTVELINDMQDRIEALEAALRRIACDGEPYDKCHCVNSEECSYGIARAALGEEKDED